MLVALTGWGQEEDRRRSRRRGLRRTPREAGGPGRADQADLRLERRLAYADLAMTKLDDNLRETVSRFCRKHGTGEGR